MDPKLDITALRDAAVAPLWLGANVVLVCAAWRLSRRAHPDATPMLRAADVIVGSWACLVASAVALGACGVLTGLSLPAVVSAVSVLGARAVRPARGPDDAGSRDRPWLLAVWLPVVALGAGHVVTGGLLGFPEDYECLMVHMPMVDQWVAARGLYAPDCRHWSNPGNGELVTLWVVGGFSGDFLLALTNVPALLLLASGTAELGRELGLGRPTAHLTALAASCNVIALRQVTDACNDVAVAALFPACLLYGIRYARGSRPGDLVFGAVGLGLLCGVKPSALGYALTAWGAGVALAAERRGLRAGARVALVGAAAVAVWAGYWYARNAWLTGRPFYPGGGAPGEDVLVQMYGHVESSSFLGNPSPGLLPLALRAARVMASPWHYAALLAAPASMAWLSVSGLRRLGRPGGGESGVVRLAVCGLLVATTMVLVAMPFTVEDQWRSLNLLAVGYTPARYGLCVLNLALVALAMVVQDVLPATDPSRTLSPAGVALSAAATAAVVVLAVRGLCGRESGLRVDFAGTVAVAVGLVATAGGLTLWVRAGWPGRRAAVATAAALVAVSVGWLSARWDAGYPAHYREFFHTGLIGGAALEGVTGRLCVLDLRPYPYFGPRRRTRLTQPVRIPSGAWFRRYLADRGVTHLVARSYDAGTTGGWKMFDNVDPSSDNEIAFHRVYWDPTFTLYAVNPAGVAPGARSVGDR